MQCKPNCTFDISSSSSSWLLFQAAWPTHTQSINNAQRTHILRNTGGFRGGPGHGPSLAHRAKSYSTVWRNKEKANKKLCYCRGTARRATSVEIVQNTTQMFDGLHLITSASSEWPSRSLPLLPFDRLLLFSISLSL